MEDSDYNQLYKNLEYDEFDDDVETELDREVELEREYNEDYEEGSQYDDLKYEHFEDMFSTNLSY